MLLKLPLRKSKAFIRCSKFLSLDFKLCVSNSATLVVNGTIAFFKKYISREKEGEARIFCALWDCPKLYFPWIFSGKLFEIHSVVQSFSISSWLCQQLWIWSYNDIGLVLLEIIRGGVEIAPLPPEKLPSYIQHPFTESGVENCT